VEVVERGGPFRDRYSRADAGDGAVAETVECKRVEEVSGRKGSQFRDRSAATLDLYRPTAREPGICCLARGTTAASSGPAQRRPTQESTTGFSPAQFHLGCLAEKPGNVLSPGFSLLSRNGRVTPQSPPAPPGGPSVLLRRRRQRDILRYSDAQPGNSFEGEGVLLAGRI